MSLFSYLLVDKLVIKYNWSANNNLVTNAITFISSSSLWIYLWHIFFVYYWQNLLVKNLPEFASHFSIAFLVVTLGAMTITYLQKRWISRLIDKTKFGQHHSYLLAVLFLK